MPLDIREMMEKHREGILYVVCGGATCAVTWLSYMLFIYLGLELNISNILSWVCGVLFAFVVNKWIVFECRSVKPAVVAREIGSFFAARIGTGLVAIVLFPVLIGLGLNQSFMGTEGMVAKLTTSFIEIVLNYVLSKWVVFRK